MFPDQPWEYSEDEYYDTSQTLASLPGTGGVDYFQSEAVYNPLSSPIPTHSLSTQNPVSTSWAQYQMSPPASGMGSSQQPQVSSNISNASQYQSGVFQYQWGSNIAPSYGDFGSAGNTSSTAVYPPVSRAYPQQGNESLRYGQGGPSTAEPQSHGQSTYFASPWPDYGRHRIDQTIPGFFDDAPAPVYGDPNYQSNTGQSSARGAMAGQRGSRGSSWTEVEDNLLIQFKAMGKTWPVIADQFPGHEFADGLSHFESVCPEWFPHEDAIIRSNPENSQWNNVAEELPGRTAKEARLRAACLRYKDSLYQQSDLGLQNRALWSPDELSILRLARAGGQDWEEIELQVDVLRWLARPSTIVLD